MVTTTWLVCGGKQPQGGNFCLSLEFLFTSPPHVFGHACRLTLSPPPITHSAADMKPWDSSNSVL